MNVIFSLQQSIETGSQKKTEARKAPVHSEEKQCKFQIFCLAGLMRPYLNRTWYLFLSYSWYTTGVKSISMSFGLLNSS